MNGDAGQIPPDEAEAVAPEVEVEIEIEVLAPGDVIDGPLVLHGSRMPSVRVAPQGAALVQAAAVAATGFVAGVATAAVLGRRRQRRLAESPATGRLRAVAHRTYLVDVHLLERS